MSGGPNIMQAMSDAGLNPFGAVLLAESLLRSPIAQQIVDKGEPIKLFMPIKRGDCEGWDGVEITLMPVRTRRAATGCADGGILDGTNRTTSGAIGQP